MRMVKKHHGLNRHQSEQTPGDSGGFPGGSDSKASAYNGVRFLCWEDPLEKEMVIHSSTLAWKIPWTEEPGKLQSMGLQRVGQD